MKKSLYIFLSFYMMFTSCKKTELPPENADQPFTPVFYAKCSVGSQSLSIAAGADDYYMNSSYYYDSSKVYVYEADLKQKSCTGACGYAVTVLINDYQMSSANTVMNVNTAIKPAVYRFDTYTPDPVSYTAKFTPVDAFTSSASYRWEFSDGIKQNGYEVTRTFDANKNYSARLIFSSPCDANHLNVFNVGNPLQTLIQAARNMDKDGLNYQFMATPTGAGPYKFSWDFGDNTPLVSDVNPNHTFAASGRYITKLQITDAAGDSCTSYYQVAASYEKICTANYTFAFTPVSIPVLFSAITIKVTDPNGIVYSSKNVKQPVSSNFQVVSVEDYKTNEQGQATKKMKIRFNCTLQNGSNQLVVNNGEAVIAVAFK